MGLGLIAGPLAIIGLLLLLRRPSLLEKSEIEPRLIRMFLWVVVVGFAIYALVVLGQFL